MNTCTRIYIYTYDICTLNLSWYSFSDVIPIEDFCQAYRVVGEL